MIKDEDYLFVDMLFIFICDMLKETPTGKSESMCI